VIVQAPSPEERLLKVIRGTGKPTPPPTATSAPPVTQSKQGSPLLLVINIILGIAIVGLAIGIGWRVMHPATLDDMPVLATNEIALPDAHVSDTADFNIEMFTGREIFEAIMVAQVTEEDPMAKQLAAQAAMATLVLMGVMDDEPPQAIITDSKTNRSHFVSVGDSFGSGISVVEIIPGRVTLSYEGIDVELHL
jgi:hypothetical protein